MQPIGTQARRHLEELPRIDPEVVAAYRRDGHVVVRGLIDPDVVLGFRPVLEAAIERSGRRTEPAGDSAYERAFLQMVNAGHQDPVLALLTRSPRIGAWVAAFLGAPGARLLVEDTFLKLPGGVATPWHQDASVAPMDPAQVMTAWVPLHRIDRGMGLMRFATGSHLRGLLGPVDISEATQAEFDRILATEGMPIIDYDALEPGDVSFHSGFTVHGSWPNDSADERLAVALHCFADGARIRPIENENQAALLARLAPGLAPGDEARAPVWPRIFPAEHE